MSNHDRTSRRRRIAFGLGATGGGLLAAAFMPMGIALAAPTPDPGLFPVDTETTPDAFYDFLGLSDTANNAGATLADQQLDLDNAALAAQIDYDADNGIPFSFSGLDGIPNEPAGYVDPAGSDPFLTGLDNTVADPSTTQIADATSYDYALNQLLPADQVTYLDGIATGANTTLGAVPVVPDNDPAADFVQIFDPHAFNPVTGAPTDFVGEFASYEDQFLNAFGLGGPLDQFVDTFTGSFTNPMTEALGGLGSTTADTLTGLGGTGTDMFTGVLGGIDPLSFFGL